MGGIVTGKQCTAISKWKKKAGYPEEECRCTRFAVTGYDVCNYHGAGTPKRGTKGGRPLEHGVYSQKLKVPVKEMYEAFMDDVENIGNIDQDIALMRAMMIDAINNTPTDENGKPVTNHGLIRAYMRDLRDSIALRDDLLSATSIPIEQVRLFLNQVLFILQKRIDDPDLLNTIVADLQNVSIVQEEQPKKLTQGKSIREKNKERNRR